MSPVENPVNNGYSLYLGTTVSQLALVYSQSYGIPLAVVYDGVVISTPSSLYNIIVPKNRLPPPQYTVKQ